MVGLGTLWALGSDSHIAQNTHILWTHDVSFSLVLSVLEKQVLSRHIQERLSLRKRM